MKNPQIKPKTAALIIVPLFLAIAGFASWRTDSKRMHYSAPSASQAAEPVFNVPAMVGLPIGGVQRFLGQPSRFSDPLTTPHPARTREWDMTFTKGGRDLLVTYELETGRVIDFFIPTSDPSGKTRDLIEIRAVGNLVEAPTRYALIPVPAGNSGQFTGLKIVPR